MSVSKLQTVSANILNLFYELSVFECSGLYDSDEYNLKPDDLLEMLEEEKKLYLLKDEVSCYFHEGMYSNILYKRFRRCISLMNTFSKNTFSDGRINYRNFDDINNRKKVINSIVALDLELLSFRYFRDVIDSCEDETTKEKLINIFYQETCSSVLSSRELAKNKFVFEDNFILKGYFYADLMGVDRDYVKDAYDKICKDVYTRNLNIVFSHSNIQVEDFYMLMSVIKASASLISDKVLESPYEQLYYKYQLHRNCKDAFTGIKDILDNREKLKTDYQILTYGKSY